MRKSSPMQKTRNLCGRGVRSAGRSAQRIEGYYAVTIDAEIMSKAGSGFQEAGLAVIGILMAALLLAICCFRRGKWMLRNADFLVSGTFLCWNSNSGGCNDTFDGGGVEFPAAARRKEK